MLVFGFLFSRQKHELTTQNIKSLFSHFRHIKTIFHIKTKRHCTYHHTQKKKKKKRKRFHSMIIQKVILLFAPISDLLTCCVFSEHIESHLKYAMLAGV